MRGRVRNLGWGTTTVPTYIALIVALPKRLYLPLSSAEAVSSPFGHPSSTEAKAFNFRYTRCRQTSRLEVPSLRTERRHSGQS